MIVWHRPSRALRLPSILVAVLLFFSTKPASAVDTIVVDSPVFSGIFGSRILNYNTPNDVNNINNPYDMIHHVNSPAGYDAIQYDAGRGYGFEVLSPGNGGRNTSARFGPFDDSPNGRNRFADSLPDEIYDSFIGFKSYSTPRVHDPPEGGIFRIDVPNGLYRFVGAFGDSDNPHGHRVIVEDGGAGAIGAFGPNHQILVGNHDQSQFNIGQARGDCLGCGVFARVGFTDILATDFFPPLPQGAGATPVFVDYGADGEISATGPDSPILEVTQGYIRVHLLKAITAVGPGGKSNATQDDPNGTDIVLFEVIPVIDLTEPPVIPEPATLSLLAVTSLAFIRRRPTN